MNSLLLERHFLYVCSIVGRDPRALQFRTWIGKVYLHCFQFKCMLVQYLHICHSKDEYVSIWSLLSLSLPPLPFLSSSSSTAERMVQMGFTSKEIRESLAENRYDEVCATYMLLERELGDSNVSSTVRYREFNVVVHYNYIED